MNKKLLIFALIAGVFVSLPFVTRQISEKEISGYPWDITVHESGLSTVFGLSLGQMTMADVLRTVGSDMKLALLSVNDEPGSVEMYYAHFTAGRLSGRLIVVADLDVQTVGEIRQRAIRSGGEHQFRIHRDDLPAVMRAPIKGLTFIPIVDLDADIIVQRFGKPAEVISQSSTLSHYLYPEKGLDIVLDTDGKEVLQYVAPNQFTRLVQPLR